MTRGPLQPLLAASRRREAAIACAFALPAAIAAGGIGWRLHGTTAAVAAVAGVALFGAAITMGRNRALDSGVAVRSLDAAEPGFEDSSDLLAADPSALQPLQRLQRERIAARVAARAPDLRRPWPRAALAMAWAGGLLCAAAAIGWPAAPGATPAQPSAVAARGDRAPTAIEIASMELDVRPPAYTGLPARTSASLSARVPAGASLQWRLQLEPTPATVDLRFVDGRTVALARDGDGWTGSATLDRAGLYRIVVAGDLPLRPDALHRIDVVADQPPRVRVLAPAQSLSLRGDRQARWPLRFEAVDDHGVGARARLQLTIAQGTGEQVAFREQTRVLDGSGPATRRTFAHALDLEALGLSPGDDVIARLEVDDNRRPSPQSARSASVILRWPASTAPLATGIEGLVNDVLPAYFRSQRQIIIDAEALIAKRDTLSDDAFTARSDAIGVDQRLLRLRYGQFLGEEAEGAPTRLMPTVDAEDDHAGAHPDDGHDDHAAAPAAGHDDHAHGDGDPGGTAADPGFGRAGNLLEEFGHAHDNAEAATLLDPDTRGLLKAALDEMWQSELQLRSARPAAALPFAHRALELVKEVQQAGRIYLARLGNAQPAIDFGRRMTGKRDGIAGSRLPPLAPAAREDAPGRLWQALDGDDADALAAAIDGIGAWLRTHDDAGGDALSLAAAVDALRQAPDCARCRDDLRRALWPLLQPPPARPPARAGADATGRAYLDALRDGGDRR